MYGENVSKLIGVEADTYLYFEIFLELYMAYIKERREYLISHVEMSWFISIVRDNVHEIF